MESTKNQPTIFIIFGGTGDLNARKLAPALIQLIFGWLAAKTIFYHWYRPYQIIRRRFPQETAGRYQPVLAQRKGRKKKWDEFSQNLFYQASDINDSETYKEFGKTHRCA